jgi:hypothetical protein
MAYPKFDRSTLRIKKLDERESRIDIERDHVKITDEPASLPVKSVELISKAAGRIRNAKKNGKPVIMAFGAHTIKNGLAPVLQSLMERGWLTHLCTNGAGIIHDWEFSWGGKSSENVRKYIEQGQFGIWHETGFYINLALLVGAYEGLGYGESIGKMISRQGLDIPGPNDLRNKVLDLIDKDADSAAAAADLFGELSKLNIKPGFLEIPHPFRKYSVQSFAYDHGIPFSGHPMIGHDIIYTHPLNNGAAVGRAAVRDFLAFAENISKIEGGVYISLGSAVMSPMIFEKAFSMAVNRYLQFNGKPITGHYMLVVDLAVSERDWRNEGEPSPGDPSYYLRYCKTFSRMGGEMDYLTADNRDFLLALLHELENSN